MIAERFAAAAKLADAVLYEGYMLYPYRKSALKNQRRWQFGVVTPRPTDSEGEEWFAQSGCLIEGPGEASLTVKLRFLQLQSRVVQARNDGAWEPRERLEVAGRVLLSWEEAVPCEVGEDDIPVAELFAGRVFHFDVAGSRAVEEIPDTSGAIAARIVREREALSVVLRLAARPIAGRVALTVRVENGWTGKDLGRGADDRSSVSARSLLSCHALVGLIGGAFVSPLDSTPGWDVERSGRGWWPVLLGPPPARDMMLCSPMILSEYPEIAPESEGDFFDATEIDELLTLRVMTLTDAEKRELSATDDRARRILDRVERMPSAATRQLHGAIRSDGPAPIDHGAAPSWEAFVNPPGLATPETATITIAGETIGRGSRVRLSPRGRADAMDMFLSGRLATVAAVYQDLDDRTHVAVTLDDDPSADLRRALGRYFYFAPEEMLPLPPDGAHV